MHLKRWCFICIISFKSVSLFSLIDLKHLPVEGVKKGPAKVGGVSDNGAAGVNVSGEEGAPKPDEVFFFFFFF